MNPRREEAPWKTALVHAHHVAYPLQGAVPHVVAQILDANTLLQLHRGDAVELHLVHCHAAHVANALVAPIAQRCEHALLRQAPRLSPVKILQSAFDR